MSLINAATVLAAGMFAASSKVEGDPLFKSLTAEEKACFERAAAGLRGFIGSGDCAKVNRAGVAKYLRTQHAECFTSDQAAEDAARMALQLLPTVCSDVY